MQREGAARQSIKVVSWPNSVLVAPLLVALQSYSVASLGVARPNGPATPPTEKKAVLTGLGHTMARQRAFVAPVVLAQQAYSLGF